jgi:hypothetical protein
MFLCLVVLAQLLLPTAFERARAAEIGGCAALTNAATGDQDKQSGHAHGQECPQCLPQAVALAAPLPHPEVSVVPALETMVAHGESAAASVMIKPLPPPTGPPASIAQV